MRFSRTVHGLIALVTTAGAALAFAPFATPAAYAAEAPQPLAVQVTDAAGRVAEVVTIEYKVINRSNQPRANMSIDVTAPSNTDLVSYPGRACVGRDPTQRVTCKANKAYPVGTTTESFTVRIRSARGTSGTVRLYVSLTDSGATFDRFSVSGTARSSPSTSSSPTRRAPVTPLTTEPEVPTEESGAANVVEEAGTEPTTARASAERAGVATGMWIGIGAILVSVGLLATLLVLRRREGDADSEEPQLP
jgi:hypothetical protein